MDRVSYQFDAEYPERISIHEDSLETLEILPNQAYVYVDFEHFEDSVVVRYAGPADMGRGGATYPWGDYSKSHPLAIGYKLDENGSYMYLDWKGFYHKDTGYLPNGVDDAETKYEGVYKLEGYESEIDTLRANENLSLRSIANFIFSEPIFIGQPREDVEYILGRPHDVYNRSGPYKRYAYRSLRETYTMHHTIIYKAGRASDITTDVVKSPYATKLGARALLLGLEEMPNPTRNSRINAVYFKRYGNINIEVIQTTEGYVRVSMNETDRNPYLDD